MKRKELFHIGRIMTILGIKHFESPSLRKLKQELSSEVIRSETDTVILLYSWIQKFVLQECQP